MKINLVEDWEGYKSKNCTREGCTCCCPDCYAYFLREKETEINEQIERDRIEYALEVLSGVAIKFEDFSDGWNKVKATSVELRKKLHAIGIKPSGCKGYKAKVDFSPKVENQEQGGA